MSCGGLPFATVVVLAMLGCWELGQGVYIHANAWLAQYLLRDAWVPTLNGEGQAKPWPWADTWPVGRLTVPGKDIDLIVLAGAGGRSLAFGPGHLDGTPVPGQPGNSVISAHRDTHFRFLRHLKVNDGIHVQTADRKTHVFRVSGMGVVDAEAARLVLEGVASHLTLVTCYPFDAVVPGGALRYVVTAKYSLPSCLSTSPGKAKENVPEHA